MRCFSGCADDLKCGFHESPDALIMHDIPNNRILPDFKPETWLMRGTHDGGSWPIQRASVQIYEPEAVFAINLRLHVNKKGIPRRRPFDFPTPEFEKGGMPRLSGPEYVHPDKKRLIFGVESIH